MNRYELFSKRLKELRNDMKLTQKQFAEKIGFTQATLSAYENNPKSPSLDIIVDIATKCNVSLDWLCGLSDRKNDNDKRGTLGDVVEKMVEISRLTDVTPKLETKPFSNEEVGVIEFCDENICTFIQKWEDMKKLYDNSTILPELYELWIKNQIEIYSCFRRITIKKD